MDGWRYSARIRSTTSLRAPSLRTLLGVLLRSWRRRKMRRISRVPRDGEGFAHRRSRWSVHVINSASASSVEWRSPVSWCSSPPCCSSTNPQPDLIPWPPRNFVRSLQAYRFVKDGRSMRLGNPRPSLAATPGYVGSFCCETGDLVFDGSVRPRGFRNRGSSGPDSPPYRREDRTHVDRHICAPSEPRTSSTHQA